MKRHHLIAALAVGLMLTSASAQERPDGERISSPPASERMDPDALALALDRLEEMEPDDPERASLLLRVAGGLEALAIHFERKAFESTDAVFVAEDAGEDEATITAHRERAAALLAEAQRVNTRAYKLRLEFERAFPDARRADVNLYMLGDHERRRQVGSGAARFTALVERFPDSPFVGDALLALAEDAFNNERMEKAKRLYEAVIERSVGGSGATLERYARYKLAWTHFNLDEHVEGLRVLVSLVKEKGLSDAMRREVERDTVLFYAHAPVQPEKARAFFESFTEGEATERALERLESLYRDVGRDADADAVASQRSR